MDRPVVRLFTDQAVKTQLQTLTVGRASVLEFEVVGAPENLQRLQFHAGRPGSEIYTPVVATALPDNRWRVYANGLNFPDPGNAKYHLTGKDDKDRSVWLGSGALDIRQSVLYVDEDAILPIPEDTYVRDPRTGLWHKLTARIDEEGEVVIDYEKNGVTR